MSMAYRYQRLSKTFCDFHFASVSTPQANIKLYGKGLQRS